MWLHRLEPHIALVRLGEDAELALLSLGPLGIVPEELECNGLVRDVVICVVWFNIERLGKLTVSLLPGTFVVAFQGFALWPFRIDARGQTLDLLLAPLAVAD